MVGHFIGGCNQSFAGFAQDEVKFRKSSLRSVKLWVSTGKTDKLVTEQSVQEVIADSKKSGYRVIEDHHYEGGHQTNKKEFAKALRWFAEETP